MESRTLNPPDEAANRRQRRLQLAREVTAKVGECPEKLVQELNRLMTAEQEHIPTLPNEPLADRVAKGLAFTLFHDMINFSWALDVPAWPWAPKSKFVHREFPPLVQQMRQFSESDAARLAGPVVRSVGLWLRSSESKTSHQILQYVLEETRRVHSQVMATKIVFLLTPLMVRKTEGRVPVDSTYKIALQPLFHRLYMTVNYLLLFILFPDRIPLAPGEVLPVQNQRPDAQEAEMKQSFYLGILQILSHLHYCRVQFPDSDLVAAECMQQLYSLGAEEGFLGVWEQMPKPAIYYQWFPEATAKYSLRPTIESDDDKVCNRAHFYLEILEPLFLGQSAEFLTNEVVPLLFLYLEGSNMFTNAISHAIMRSFMDHFMNEFGLTLIPKYMEVSLRHYPRTTRVESLVQTMALIVDLLPARNSQHGDLAMYCVQQMADKIRQLEDRKLSSKIFTLSLFYLISVCDPSILVPMLRIVEEVVVGFRSREQQTILMAFLKNLITRNYDVTRKSICVNWYLHLVQLLNMNETQVDAPAAKRSTATLQVLLQPKSDAEVQSQLRAQL